ncbi:glutaredoxin family protein [Nitrospina watsonii]|uniref:Glutaredoxin-like protein n=1 Tax=Nitrospina watsonii TaxID=1323948 RepID=A0ABN8W299_9BACT|nr:glutaredoxin family protein [Nitrospina watsonii]CAI2718800.1 Glutaredoxin-like protein [Nitrospina watsonii]
MGCFFIFPDKVNFTWEDSDQVIDIEILTKSDCCLCDDAKAVVEAVLAEYPATLTLTDVESDAALFDAYKEKIPVVRLNGEDSFLYKVHPVTLRKRLEEIDRGK